MKKEKKGGAFRRVLSLLLALMLLTLCGEMAPEAQAAEKTLRITPGHYVRWRKGLPPEDGEWYRILLVSTTWGDRFLQGNTIINSVNDAQDAYLSLQNDIGKFEKYFPGFDLGSDVNYTLHFYNTPQVRFAKYDNKNNHDSAAPMYYIRLSDWTGDEGQRTELGPVPGDTANRGTDDIFFLKEPSVPWAFVTAASDDDVDEGRVVVEQFRQGGVGQSWNLSIAPIWDGYVCTGELEMWWTTQENVLYYGDEITIDTIADGQVIEDGEIVNINKGSYLTLAAGSTLTVKDGGILSIGSGMYNDGTIRVEKGGTLLVKQDAFIMPWETGQKTGNIVCDGGDVIVYSGGRVVCEGPSGFKFTGESGRYGTVYNYGAIITSAFTAAGKARSFHNEGSVMLGYTVNARSSQAFRDGTLTIASGRAAVTGLKTGKINVDQVTDGVITGNGVVRP